MKFIILSSVGFLLIVSCRKSYEDEVGLGMQELEFLSEELTPVECQQLKEAFSLDKRFSLTTYI